MFREIKHSSSVKDWSESYLVKMYYYYRSHLSELNLDKEFIYHQICRELRHRQVRRKYDIWY